ncbi:MAG: NAD-dependent epimerase/dehydratase family protein [Planctomycetes bacterium]|nr:NAD-dependent epimerase/dehydratase family protein [Planctomycetota bacterium]
MPAQLADRLRPSFDGRLCCVTGGAGFIGGHLAETLVGLGARVAVIDDLSNASAAHVAGLIDQAPDRVRFVHASILERSALDEAMDGCELAFHLAALGSVPRSVEDPTRTWLVNATGTMRVLESAHRSGARRLVYSASSSAYGDNPDLPKRETMAPEPMSPYAAAKLAGESLCRAWSACYGLDTACLRYFNIFGPRQAADSAYAAVVPAFIKALAGDRAPTVYGDGGQTRDFTHVSNAVAANLLAAASPRDLAGGVANIGAGVRTSVNDLAARLAALCDRPDLTPEHQPARVGEVRDSVADISVARDLIGYEPVTDLETGLAQTVDWYRGRTAADAGEGRR